jgi:hypothetical protein
MAGIFRGVDLGQADFVLLALGVQDGYGVAVCYRDDLAVEGFGVGASCE